MNKSLKIIYQDIKISLKLVINQLKPECIILYGSIARGDYNERSDIDIIIISTQLPDNFYTRLQLIYDLIDVKDSIDILGYTPNEFIQMLKNRHATSLFAMSEGIPIYGKSYFNRLKEVCNKIIKKYKLKKTFSAWVPEIFD